MCDRELLREYAFLERISRQRKIVGIVMMREFFFNKRQLILIHKTHIDITYTRNQTIMIGGFSKEFGHVMSVTFCMQIWEGLWIV